MLKSPKLFPIILAVFLTSCQTTSKSTLKYNYHQDEFQHTTPQSQLRYNVYEKTWNYAEPGETLRWNVYEKKWEYAK